jgi:hypothetical protein
MAQRRNREWTEPRPLGGGVNTPGNETFPAVTPDGCGLSSCVTFLRSIS